MSQFDSGGSVLGSGLGDAEFNSNSGNQSSLFPPTRPSFGGGPIAEQVLNTSIKDEDVRLRLSGLYNRVSYTAAATDAAFPTVTLALEFSLDAVNWFAPSPSAELSAAGIQAGKDSTGYLWARVRVKTKSSSGNEYVRVILAASNTTA